MKVDFNNTINFKASFVNPELVGKYNPNRNFYEHKRVSFIKLDPYDINDIKMLENITNSWEYDLFSTNIYNDALDVYSKDSDKSRVFYEKAFYALTSQTENFRNPDYKKVLGICDVREYENGEAMLLHLQVNPEHIYSLKSEYKGSGSVILSSLKNLYNQIQLISRRDKSVRDFYIKNGFVNVGESLTKFIWKK